MEDKSLKPGMTAILKTTEEPVFILKIDEQSDADGLGQVATVRRPVAGQDGIRYVVDTFYLSELETTEQRMERTMKEMMSFRGKQKSFGGDDPLDQIN